MPTTENPPVGSRLAGHPLQAGEGFSRCTNTWDIRYYYHDTYYGYRVPTDIGAHVRKPGRRACAPDAFMSPVRTSRLFGLDLHAVTFHEAVRLLSAAATDATGAARVVVTPNVDHLMRLERMPQFRTRYAQADFIFADGMPLVWASRMLGASLPERVTGADLFVAMCRQAVAHRWRVALLGGRPGTEADLVARFQHSFPGLHIDIIAPSMQFDPDGEEGQEAAERIAAMQAQVVFVCLGMPKQEEWALRHAAALPGGVALCVGAAMEFAIGLQQRAPLWVQRSGLEWLWRLASQPRRLWRRYLIDDPKFLALCWREWRQRRALRA